jgi:hypothetical protein
MFNHGVLNTLPAQTDLSPRFSSVHFNASCSRGRHRERYFAMVSKLKKLGFDLSSIFFQQSENRGVELRVELFKSVVMRVEKIWEELYFSHPIIG